MITDIMTMTEPVRRIEVFTGSGRRRAWSVDDKARIVAESLACGQSVSETARRHGLSTSQLFAWRRQVRELASDEMAPPPFVPAIVDAPKAAPDVMSGAGGIGISPHVPVIELEISGVTVRIGRGADMETVAMVIRAVKASR
jgi:transposase